MVSALPLSIVALMNSKIKEEFTSIVNDPVVVHVDCVYYLIDLVVSEVPSQSRSCFESVDELFSRNLSIFA